MARNAAWLLAIPIAACGRFGLDAAPDEDGGTSLTDASVGPDTGLDGIDAQPSADVEAGTDASRDASVNACAIFDDDFSAPPNGWTSLGDARLDGGKALLVPAVNQKQGAIWRPLLPTRAALRVTFRFQIDQPPSSIASDGLAFAWVDSQTAPVLGGDAQDLGLCGKLNGFAVVVNSRDRQYELRDLQNGCSDILVSIPVTAVTGVHTADVIIRGTSITFAVEGIKFSKSLPRSTIIRWIGFGAATGGFNAMHSVDDLTVSACLPPP